MTVSDTAPARPTAKRLAKREHILRAAAGFINRNGAGHTNMASIADTLGMTRKSLYYYVADRDELIFQCYRRTCRMLMEALAAADREESTPPARLRAFLVTAIAGDASEQAAITDIDFLPDVPRQAIEAEIAAVVDRLQSLIAEGIADGSFRDIDRPTAAHLILGIFNWLQIAADWLGYAPSPPARQAMSAATADLILKGIGSQLLSHFRPAQDIESLQPRVDNPFDRKQLHQARMEQIATAASHLFNRRGIEATSLDDVVAALNMSKSAIFHYFASKDDLITACYLRTTRMQRAFLTAAPEECSGLIKLATAIHLNAQAQFASLSPLVWHPGLASLPRASLNEIQAEIATVSRLGRALYHAGQDDGSVRPLDALLTGSAIGGSMLWIAKWIEPDGQDEQLRLADTVTEILCNGLISRE